MGVSTTTVNDGKELILKISGRFDHTVMADFRRAYETAPGRPDVYVLDMRDVSYMDSSGLSILLLLHVHVGNRKFRVRIINCNPAVSKVLAISKFDELFDIQ
jgi:anti-anti-sigma factor